MNLGICPKSKVTVKSNNNIVAIYRVDKVVLEKAYILLYLREEYIGMIFPNLCLKVLFERENLG